MIRRISYDRRPPWNSIGRHTNLPIVFVPCHCSVMFRSASLLQNGVLHYECPQENNFCLRPKEYTGLSLCVISEGCPTRVTRTAWYLLAREVVLPLPKYLSTVFSSLGKRWANLSRLNYNLISLNCFYYGFRPVFTVRTLCAVQTRCFLCFITSKSVGFF
jgi:hypothetical protein